MSILVRIIFVKLFYIHFSAIVVQFVRVKDFSVNIFIFIGQITIVAIGPLTTLATCVIADPSFGSRLDTIFVMGGNSGGEGNVTINAEFNFLFDPEAAHVVINRANCPRLRIIPWETCYQHKINWVNKIVNNKCDGTLTYYTYHC